MHTPLPDKPPADAGAPQVVRRAVAHDSAARHVTGTAAYVDDLREPSGTLHVAVGGSPVARGRVKALDLIAVRAAPGVVAVLTASDIPGHNNIGAIVADEPVFAENKVAFHGQPLFAVVAESYMCLAAAYWSRVDRVVYAATQHEAAAAGFDDAFLYEELAKPIPARSLKIERVTGDGEDPFAVWLANPNRIPY